MSQAAIPDREYHNLGGGVDRQRIGLLNSVHPPPVSLKLPQFILTERTPHFPCRESEMTPRLKSQSARLNRSHAAPRSEIESQSRHFQRQLRPAVSAPAVGKIIRTHIERQRSILFSRPPLPLEHFPLLIAQPQVDRPEGGRFRQIPVFQPENPLPLSPEPAPVPPETVPRTPPFRHPSAGRFRHRQPVPPIALFLPPDVSMFSQCRNPPAPLPQVKSTAISPDRNRTDIS